MKSFIRTLLTRSGLTKSSYEKARAIYHRTRKLTFYIADARQTFRDMQWNGNNNNNNAAYWAKSSELLFQYHKLEKGLCMPGARRFFGYDPATATLALLKNWRTSGYSSADPLYLGALETLHAYRQRIDEQPANNTAMLKKAIDAELHSYPTRTPQLETPCLVGVTAKVGSFEELNNLALARRSVRTFAPTQVQLDLIQKAIQIAQLSPSACNRQPWRVHHYGQRTSIDAMLELQNGNRGFGHTIPCLLVLTAEASSFFDASERHEPYVDGGLFAMSLILALQAQGIASCCLNWCVEPKQDKAAHTQGNIPTSERIVMYLAVGYPAEGALVPRSPRRHIDTTLISHG